MSWIPPLLVAIPLLTAAVTAGLDHVTPQPVQHALGIAASAATTALAFVLLWHAESHEVVHWFGGWEPRHGLALGIDFAVGPLAAGMCAVIGLVVTLALVYSLTFMRGSARLFDSLMLVALGAMCGFAMSGDLFNLFVWLELMGAAAYALTGFQVERLGPVQGAVNFAITNSLGGYLFAIGIALIYARTGSLNLAQIGDTLSHGPAGGLVIVAMTLLLCGFLIKGAVVPFHLWAADAYAVAPAPVCAVLGGVMTDIGLIGVTRLYWTVFDAPFGHSHAVGRRPALARDRDRVARRDDGLPAAAPEADARLLGRLPHRDHARRDRAAERVGARRDGADVPRPCTAHRGAVLRRRDPPLGSRGDRRAAPARARPRLLGSGARLVRRDDRAPRGAVRRDLSRSRPDRRGCAAVGARAALARLRAGRRGSAPRRAAHLPRLGRARTTRCSARRWRRTRSSGTCSGRC